LSLAGQLGISVVPLREALRKLEAQGLVRIVPHRGAYVSPISREEIEDIYSIRITLEGMATRQAVLRLADGDLEKLGVLIHQMESALGLHDYPKLLELNKEFHWTIYEASGRTCLCDIISKLLTMSMRYRTAYIHMPDRARQAHEEHKEILSAILNRSGKEAVWALQNNIRQTMVGLISAFEVEGASIRAQSGPLAGGQDLIPASLAEDASQMEGP